MTVVFMLDFFLLCYVHPYQSGISNVGAGVVNFVRVLQTIVVLAIQQKLNLASIFGDAVSEEEAQVTLPYLFYLPY
jgi:hypothetical protein